MENKLKIKKNKKNTTKNKLTIKKIIKIKIKIKRNLLTHQPFPLQGSPIVSSLTQSLY
jgi:hypothetical protein